MITFKQALQLLNIDLNKSYFLWVNGKPYMYAEVHRKIDFSQEVVEIRPKFLSNEYEGMEIILKEEGKK